MTQLFHSYQQQYIQNSAALQKKIDNISIQTNLKKELAFSDFKIDLSECEKNIKYMQTQVSSFTSQLKVEYQIKIRRYKKSYEQLKRKINRLQEEYVFQKNKQMLMGARIDEEQNAKEKFLKEGQLLSDATYKIKQSVQVMRETQQVSNGIQIQLVSHTERLTKNKQKLNVIDQELSYGQSLLRDISSRIQRNKYILAAVISAIVLIGIIILWIVLAKKKAANGQNQTSGTNSTSSGN